MICFAQELIERCRKRGLVVPDRNFPTVRDLDKFIIHDDEEFVDVTSFSDKMARTSKC